MKTSVFAKLSASGWLAPVGLILLSVIPIIAGSIRLNQLSSGAATPENARFFAASLPVVLHIFAVSIYSLLGAFQFAPQFRKRFPQWHRLAGGILIPAALMTALTGLWMTQFYPHIKYDGFVLYVIRLIVGISMIAFILFGIDAIRRRKFIEHGNWMIRAYALAMGAGMQVFTHIPLMVFPGLQSEATRTLCMAMGWIINMAVAEWIIGRSQVQFRIQRNLITTN